MIKRTYPNSRLRRTRAKGFLRDIVAENNLTTDDLIVEFDDVTVYNMKAQYGRFNDYKSIH